MNGSAVVICNTCKRSWTLGTDTSLFVHLDLCTRPCPWCESYTLACQDEAAERPPRRARDFEAAAPR